MWRNFYSSRIAGLTAAAVLIAGTLAPASAKGVGHGEQNGVKPKYDSVLKSAPKHAAVEAATDKIRGTEDGQVVADHWDGMLSALSNISSQADNKFAYGTRITVPASVTPFTLTGILDVTLEFMATNGGTPSGLQVGDPIQFLVFTDASSSGDFSNAKLIYSQDDTFKTFAADNPTLNDVIYPLTTPVTVKQGDLYLILVDKTTDTGDGTGTVMPYLPADAGGTNNDDSFLTLASLATNPSQYRHINEFFTDGPMGEFIVRAIGHVADAATPVTNTLEPVDSTLPAPTNLTGTSTGTGGTLTWTAPVLPPPTTTNVNETEPNDSPATAQAVGTNVVVAGKAKDSDPGADGGFAGDDVEDWYSFTLSSPTFVQIDLDGFGTTADFDLLLYTPAGPFNSDDAVASSGNGEGEAESIGIVLQPGTYDVAVTAFDGGVPAQTNYNLSIVAAPKVLSYNVYCGIGTVSATAANYFGSAPADATSFAITNSTPGAVYAIAAVLGQSQGALSNTATLGECAGGPTVTSATLKLNAHGKLTLKGTGFVAGSTILLNGSALASNYKVKKNGTIVKAKGPLASGADYSTVVTSGSSYTITVITAAGGCSAFTATAP